MILLLMILPLLVSVSSSEIRNEYLNIECSSDSCYKHPLDCDTQNDCEFLMNFDKVNNVNLYLFNFSNTDDYATFPIGHDSDHCYDYLMCIPHVRQQLRVRAMLGGVVELDRKLSRRVRKISGNDFVCTFEANEITYEFRRQINFFVSTGKFSNFLILREGKQMYSFDSSSEEEDEYAEYNDDKKESEEMEAIESSTLIAPPVEKNDSDVKKTSKPRSAIFTEMGSIEDSNEITFDDDRVKKGWGSLYEKVIVNSILKKIAVQKNFKNYIESNWDDEITDDDDSKTQNETTKEMDTTPTPAIEEKIDAIRQDEKNYEDKENPFTIQNLPNKSRASRFEIVQNEESNEEGKPKKRRRPIRITESDDEDEEKEVVEPSENFRTEDNILATTKSSLSTKNDDKMEQKTENDKNSNAEKHIEDLMITGEEESQSDEKNDPEEMKWYYGMDDEAYQNSTAQPWRDQDYETDEDFEEISQYDNQEFEKIKHEEDQSITERLKAYENQHKEEDDDEEDNWIQWQFETRSGEKSENSNQTILFDDDDEDSDGYDEDDEYYDDKEELPEIKSSSKNGDNHFGNEEKEEQNKNPTASCTILIIIFIPFITFFII